MDCNIKLRGMILDIDGQLQQEQLQKLSFYYKSIYHEGDINGIIFFRDLMREGLLSSSDESLIDVLMEGLRKIKRKDLLSLVKDYTKWYKCDYMPTLAQDVHQHTRKLDNTLEATEQDEDVPSSDNGNDGNEDSFITGIRRSGPQGKEEMFSACSNSPRGKKRRKIDSGALDESDLSFNDEDITDEEQCQPHSKEDEEVMKVAIEVAKKSPDDKVQVGSAIVDPNTRVVIGTGYNRMPNGCEDKFSWSDDVSEGKKLNSKYPYVFHSAKAAIKDAYENKHSLKGSILYTTLFPANTDAQWIVDCGIKEIVYLDNLYRSKPFCKASKRILDTIKYRRMERSFTAQTVTGGTCKGQAIAGRASMEEAHSTST